MPGKKPKGEYAIQTVTNVLRVLDAFREADDFGVTELATLLGLHKNNVFRLLATLEQHGYIDQSAEILLARHGRQRGINPGLPTWDSA